MVINGANKKQYTVISTFAGAGGSSLGYKMAGFKELLAIDFEEDAHETFKVNFPEVPAWKKDINNITGKEIMEFCNIKEGELDIFDGSPPCQGFSTSGKREVKDDRNSLFKQYIRLIQELKPKVFVMENVTGMVKGKMKGRFIEIMKALKELDYIVKCKQMNCKYYEVPQDRERIIFIGIRKDLNIIPTYPKAINKIITFKEACFDLKDNNEEVRGLSDVILEVAKYQGNTWSTNQKVYKKIKGNTAGCISLKWATWDRVLGTISKSEISITGIVHPNRKRYISLMEAKRCSTFPDDFKFTNRKKGIERIGNSVPPRFMYHIAKNIKENVLDKYYKDLI